MSFVKKKTCMFWLTGYPVMAQCDYRNISQLYYKRKGYITNIMLMLEDQQKRSNTVWHYETCTTKDELMLFTLTFLVQFYFCSYKITLSYWFIYETKGWDQPLYQA